MEPTFCFSSSRRYYNRSSSRSPSRTSSHRSSRDHFRRSPSRSPAWRHRNYRSSDSRSPRRRWRCPKSPVCVTDAASK